MVLLSTADVIASLGTDADKISESVVDDIVIDAISEIQLQLNINVFRERILWIDQSRRNIVNGTNTVFYLRDYEKMFLSDLNGDGIVDIDDIIVYAVPFGGGSESKLTVTAIDHNALSFTLSEAPESVKLYIDCAKSYHDMVTPDRRVYRAAKAHALMNCYFEIEFDLVGTSIKMGNMSYSGIGSNSKTSKMKSKYDLLISDLKMYGTSKNAPATFNVTKPANYRPDREYGHKYSLRVEDPFVNAYGAVDNAF